MAFPLSLFGMPFLDFMDFAIGTILILLSGALITLAISWYMPKKELLGEIDHGRRWRIPERIIPWARFVLPAGLLVLALFSLFG
ncbi:TPA: hypothetical protein HA369_03720 [Candidatus Woesearchaeota archaeon]|nr:hypothetical protein [Candidatus Woesearchaeota archaeon]